MLDRLRGLGFELLFQSHAEAILDGDFPDVETDIQAALETFYIPVTEIIGSGGGETRGTQRMRRAFSSRRWLKTKFEVKKVVNGIEKEAISHEIDHVKAFAKGTIALEIEWNNKDPFFDRDLENFKRLHAESAISAGVIITRSSTLHEGMLPFVLRFARDHHIHNMDDLAMLHIMPTPKQREAIYKRVERERLPVDFATAWASKFVADKYGEATTHWRKLLDRVNRGVGNPCPLLLIGIPDTVVRFPQAESTTTVAASIQQAAILSETIATPDISDITQDEQEAN